MDAIAILSRSQAPFTMPLSQRLRNLTSNIWYNIFDVHLSSWQFMLFQIIIGQK